MIEGLLGKKLGMTQIFDKFGNLIPVTIIETGPCCIVEIKKSVNKVTLGYGSIKKNRLRNSEKGFFDKIGISPMLKLKEFKVKGDEEYKVGDEVKADIFQAGDFIDIVGRSIGKGFQGGMKRWNWGGGPAGHGSKHHRRVGSIGASADPARTLKGTNMPGQMGAKRVSLHGVRVREVDVENNLLLVQGAIPGHKNSIVSITRSYKKMFKSLDEVRPKVKHKINPMKQSKAKAKGKK